MTQRSAGAGAVPPENTGGTRPRDVEQEENEERIVVRDRRRIDPNGTTPKVTAEDGSAPETPAGDAAAGEGADTTKPAAAEAGAARSSADPAGPGPAAEAEKKPAQDDSAVSTAGGSDEKLRAELEERTADLKRVVAEYANYRRRVDRDRSLAAEQATGAVLSSLLPVLDDLDRAREHGDLVGPFGSVAEQLTAILTKAGLTPYGEVGDPFDPMHHEAVAHSLSPDVTEPTCVTVMRRGYRYGERMLRPAMVAVADPDPDAEKPAESTGPAESTDGEPAAESTTEQQPAGSPESS